jgi:hypothetical protein
VGFFEITNCDLKLNDRVLPWYQEHGVDYSQAPDQTDAEWARLNHSMYEPDKSAAETARLGRSMYQPDQSAAEDARLGRYKSAASDAQYLQQSDAILGRKATDASRAAESARRLAQSNATARRNNPNYGNEGHTSAASMRIGPTIESARARGIYSGDVYAAKTLA